MTTNNRIRKTPVLLTLMLFLVIVFSSLAYATPYNTTYNVSSPSYHLIDGFVDDSNDSEFSTNSSISIELNDNLDTTLFTLTNHSLLLGDVITYTDHDNDFDSDTGDFNTDDEGGFNELNMTSVDNIVNVEVCFLTDTVQANPSVNISIAYNTTDPPIVLNVFSQTLTTDTWICEDVSSEHLPLFDRVDMFVGFFCPLCDGTDKFKVKRDDDGSPINYYDSGVWSFDIGRSLLINTTVTYADTEQPDGKVLSLNFDPSLTTTNSYWLRTRSTTTGSNNLYIHSYENDNDVNTSDVIVNSIDQGWNTIDLTNLIHDQSNSRLRLYSNNEINISEVELIVQTEDLINPSIEVELNPTVDKILNNLTTNANCTDNRNLSFFRMHVYNSTDTIFDSTNTSINTDTRLQIHELVDLTSFGLGTYTRNSTCVDENNNIETLIDTVTVVDSSPPIITLLTPSDASTVEIVDYPSQSDEVEFTWETNQNSDCDLYIDGNLTDTIVNQNEFTGIGIFPNNVMVDWNVNCTTTGSTLSAVSDTRELTILHVIDDAFFQRDVCPAETTGGVLLFIFLVIFGFFIFFFAGLIGFKILGIFGGIMVLMAGTYIFSCAIMFGLIITLMGILLITRAVIR